MGDPRLEASFDIDGDVYTVRFTHSALVKAEKLAGSPIQQLALKVWAGQAGFSEMLALTCAGLEGHRRKQRLGGREWTPDRTAELLDGAADFDTFALPVAEAFNATLRRWFPEENEPADPPKAAGTGTSSSEPPSEPDSTQPSSGT
jgi:hypothetical protein